MEEKDKDYPELSDLKWIMDLAFLVDMLCHLDRLNLTLQARGFRVQGNRERRREKGEKKTSGGKKEEEKTREILEEWVTATDLLISLDRLNTFGDEFFKDAKVLRSYFYAISDFSVGGRCKCNGHASECIEREHGNLVCACQHHTEGADCQRCHPFYQDRPWARATGDSANECLKCNCSGRSDQCVFDMEQYRSTGSGGRCVSCRDNTDGPHCERCRNGYYRKSTEDPCLPCNCNVNGSVSLQCDVEGRCACREGVTGEKCNTCQAGFHSIGPGGC
uniref:laminin subunit gamma-3-like n=1 Tax=Maylandia zebra TaxID=106582 RepID=UPI000D319754